MLVGAEQLDELIGYTSGRTTISKNLKQGLLKLRNSLALAKKEYDLLVEERSGADASREERSTQMDSLLFAEPADETRPKKRPAETGAKPKKEKVKVSAGNQAAKPVARRARSR